ncbi:helix-turn-helix domain-containing protein [Streptomyces sp. NPDC002795]|uniref:helix-turn-helix domain-containing protein n=1 Tax=Streptomyces sp. NPDC002795 TaxID=3364665 RepID=UPI0036AEB722
MLVPRAMLPVRPEAVPAAAGLADGAASLMTALVSERLDRAAPAEPGHAMMLRIRAHIDSHLPDPGLTPDSIAGAHGISRRCLFKLFAAEDLTVAGWIRTRRLERCARDLASPAAARQPIGMIAARWGLLDGRRFSRVFKTAYGCTPRDFRRRALAERAPHGRIGTRADGELSTRARAAPVTRSVTSGSRGTADGSRPARPPRPRRRAPAPPR